MKKHLCKITQKIGSLNAFKVDKFVPLFLRMMDGYCSYERVDVSAQISAHPRGPVMGWRITPNAEPGKAPRYAIFVAPRASFFKPYSIVTESEGSQPGRVLKSKFHDNLSGLATFIKGLAPIPPKVSLLESFKKWSAQRPSLGEVAE